MTTPPCPSCGSPETLPLIFGLMAAEGPGIRVGCYMTEDSHECTSCLVRFEDGVEFYMSISRRAGQVTREFNRNLGARLAR